MDVNVLQGHSRACSTPLPITGKKRRIAAMGSTILVMDDDECIRELLYLQLFNAGYHVLLAEDAIAAGHLLLKHRVDLILADIEMPFMDGLTFVQALKADPSVSWVPVIFITSHAGHEGRARDVGAVGYLRKPVHTDQLLTAVARNLRAAKPAEVKG
jgi:two-component system, chemotaxis family, chemotaxis protein CheY